MRKLPVRFSSKSTTNYSENQTYLKMYTIKLPQQINFTQFIEKKGKTNLALLAMCFFYRMSI